MENNILELSIQQSISLFIEHIKSVRSENTWRTYHNAMSLYLDVLEQNGISINSSANKLTEDSITWLAQRLKDFAPSTERLYLTVTSSFFDFIAAMRIANPNLSRVRLLIRQKMRRVGQRLPQFPANDIDKILIHTNNIINLPVENELDHLRNLRDRAFLITLADTGLRVHEACKLARGDIDWFDNKSIVIGKGDQENIVRFSTRALIALKDYLEKRAHLDGMSGKPLASLPLFARHDRGSGKKIKPITTTTGRNIVATHVSITLGPQAVGTITPHSFRHYFVTNVLRASGGNLKLAQELARHKNIAVTQRYAHLSNEELDRGYYDIFG